MPLSPTIWGHMQVSRLEPTVEVYHSVSVKVHSFI